MSYLTYIPAGTIPKPERSLHQQVMGLFPETLPGQPSERRAGSNILFMDNADHILVRSDIEPTRAPAGSITRDMPNNAAPASGEPVRFRIAVNAIERPRSGGTRPVADMELWLANKFDGALSEVAVLSHSRTVDHSGRSPLQVDVVDGCATVADQGALQELLRAGVGRGKAYGCGMMVVA